MTAGSSSSGTALVLPMLTPSTTWCRSAPMESARRRSRAATASAPSLLKPIRLTIAWSVGSRNSRGRGLPGCGSPVTVPTSTCPKPSAASASMPTAFLSNPAARPSADGKVRPMAFTGRVAGPGYIRVSAARRADAGEPQVVGPLGVDPGEDVAEQGVVRAGRHTFRSLWRPLRMTSHQRPRSFAQSWSDRTPMSPRSRASMPWTAAPRPCTVVMHGMSAPTEAVRIS